MTDEQAAIQLSSQSTVAAIGMGYLSTCSDTSTNFPGSTCKMVFTLSKNDLARFSSPFAALTLKTFDKSPVFEPSIIPGRGTSKTLVETEDVPVNISYTSGCLRKSALSMEGVSGSAETCGK